MKKILLIIMLGFASKVIIASSPSAPIGSQVSLNAIALQSDGKIVCTGSVIVLGVNESVVVRYNTDGSLDTTFGTNGSVITLTGSSTTANGVAIDSSGNIVIAGIYTDTFGNQGIVLIRYTSTGAFDTSFNGTGIVTTTITNSDYSGANGIVIQPSDGKIVIAGFASFSGTNEFIVARYNTNGSLDTTFNSSDIQPGVIATAINNQANATAVALQSTEEIIASGTTFDGNNFQFVSARYTTSGTLDTTYGSSGISILAIGSNSGSASSAIQSDDYIVLAGFSEQNNFAIARFTDDGTPDPLFGSGGYVTTTLGQLSQSFGISVQPDGKIVAVGYAIFNNNNMVALVRYNSDGTLDTSFGTNGNGIVTTHVGSESSAYAVSIQIDDNIDISGYSDNNALVIRYIPNGTRDVTFAIDGIDTLPRGVSLIAPTISELVFTAQNLSKDVASGPDTNFDMVYTSTTPLISFKTWLMPQSTDTQQPITIVFNIPADFDANWAPTVDLNLLANYNGDSGVANLRVRADFEGNNSQLGLIAPATGFVQTVTSGDVTITEPANGNLNYIRVSLALDNTLINSRNIAVLVIDRVATSGSEYPDDIYLGSLAFRYKKLM